MKRSMDKVCHVEVLPPKQNTQNLDRDLERFATKYRTVVESGYTVCITDNAMGLLAFQGIELIEVLGLPVEPEQLSIHLNTFHIKRDFDNMLETCIKNGVKDLLLISGDGNERLPRLKPQEIGYPEATVVTSVELLKYINREYPGQFRLGVAFNPYEPESHEFEKLQRKIDAGAEYVITQPILGKNPVTDRMIKESGLPVVIEAWMSKKLYLLSECVGYEIPEDTEYDPIASLQSLMTRYPGCGMYLALLGYKTQLPVLKEIMPR